LVKDCGEDVEDDDGEDEDEEEERIGCSYPWAMRSGCTQHRPI
jgi:hypothetical protein